MINISQAINYGVSMTGRGTVCKHKYIITIYIHTVAFNGMHRKKDKTNINLPLKCAIFSAVHLHNCSTFYLDSTPGIGKVGSQFYINSVFHLHTLCRAVCW